ncbi:MAG TPA: glycosyltransferase [Candidatus Magasanikbacteria bacterium]|nr:glycosyltransferase [Candidatus Magasanikbacteria bacterium]
MSNKPKILHLITGLDLGGAEQMMVETLPKIKNFTHIVCSLTSKGSLGEKLEKEGIKVFCLNSGKYFSLSSVVLFRKIIKSEKPDLLATRLIHADFYGRIFGRLFGIKNIVCSLESVLDQPKYGKIFFLERITGFLVKKYSAVSQAVKNTYVLKASIDPKKITVIPNGIDLTKFQTNISKTETKNIYGWSDKFIIGYAAKMRPERNHKTLLSAFADFNKKIPGSLLILAGDGPEKENLITQAKNLNIYDSVKFLGNRSDVPQLLRAFDLFVSPSSYEGMSVAILEAMACGLPIIASDIEPNREIIENNKSGLLVPPFDKNILFEKMLYVYNSPKEALKLASGAKIKSSEYSLENTVINLEKFYTPIICQTPKS